MLRENHRFSGAPLRLRLQRCRTRDTSVYRPPPGGSSVAQARLVVDPAFSLGAVDRRLFGSFVEHMGRCVYEGIFEPGHPEADDRGYRRDVLALAKELGATVIRYPGG